MDITNGKFVFSASEAYMIEGGQITAPIKGATLIGNGPDVLTRVSMVGNDLKLDEGVGTCGKDGQAVPVGVGIPTLKIDRLDSRRHCKKRPRRLHAIACVGTVAFVSSPANKAKDPRISFVDLYPLWLKTFYANRTRNQKPETGNRLKGRRPGYRGTRDEGRRYRGRMRRPRRR